MKTYNEIFANISSSRDQITPIAKNEFEARLNKLRMQMAHENVDFVILTPSTSLYYFMNFRWSLSERLLCAIISNDKIYYVTPEFERPLVETLIAHEGEFYCWEEDQNPYKIVSDIIGDKKNVILDHNCPFYWAQILQNNMNDTVIKNGFEFLFNLRSQKSKHEIALMQHAKNVTLEVQEMARNALYENMSNSEVKYFINEAHKKFGSDFGSTFCIVSFGKETAYPHGPDKEQFLQNGDMVLIDTGCCFYGYNSDITRSYVFGNPTQKQRDIWNIEKEAQLAAFNAAKIGLPCHVCDDAARDVLVKYGLGPDYKIPGLPHRTGHGIGLDVHESPNLVRGEKTLLKEGMCFSNEPNISIYGEFGIRLEDHFYMADNGPVWFTKPSYSIDEPFKKY